MADWIINKSKFCAGCAISPMVGKHYYHETEGKDANAEKPVKAAKGKRGKKSNQNLEEEDTV